MKETAELAIPFRTMPQEHWHPEKGAKLDRIIQLNCRDVHTHAGKKYTPMQVIKQPELGRTSATKEQKSSSFQMSYNK